MSTNDPIFAEIDDEVRRERYKQLWGQYGSYAIAAAVVVVLAIGGWRGYQWWEARQAAEAGAKFEAAAELLEQDKYAEAEAAFAKIRAGATLVQLYSALVYKGPGLVKEIKAGLASQARRAGLPRLTALIGRDAAAIARGEGL